MQGRAGKASKREMVIESPQQYKTLAEIEAESEAGGGSQVAVAAAAVSERAVQARRAKGSLLLRDPHQPPLPPSYPLLALAILNKPLIAEDAALKIIS